MTVRTYVVAIDQQPGEANCSILVPDFPEIASGAGPDDDIGQQALDAIGTALDARREAGEPIPEATRLDVLVKAPDWRPSTLALLATIEIDPPSTQPVRVNISLEADLLRRVDATAERRGMTRSGFLAEGARRLLREGARRHGLASARSG